LCLAAKEDHRELRVRVLEREIDVSRGSGTTVRDLSLDPKVAVGRLDLLADAAYEICYGPDAAFLHCRPGSWREIGRDHDLLSLWLHRSEGQTYLGWGRRFCGGA
jgi:hypothetical protein